MLLLLLPTLSADGAASLHGETHIVACSADKCKNEGNSTLSGLKAVKVLLGCLEVVDCRCKSGGAVGAPFPVLLLTLWPPCCARRISVDVIGSNFVNTMQVHAALCEQILTPWLIACDLLAALVIQSCCAIIEVCHVCGGGVVAQDFKAAEEAEIDILAILKVDTVAGHLHLAQPFTEPDGEEHSVNVDLNGPIPVCPESLLLDLLPGLDEHVRVDPCPGLFPLGKVEVIVDVLDLDSVNCVRFGGNPCLHIAVDLPVLTSEDACLEEKLGPHQFQFIRFFRAAGLAQIEFPAEECVGRVCNFGLFGSHHGCGMVEASPVLAWDALLHAFGQS